MTPIHFPEANVSYGPPPGITEGQVRRIPAYQGEVKSGGCDGLPLVIVAWKPSPDEILELINGGSIYLSMTGGPMPHFLTTNFEVAKNPA